jgi:outer membrane protein OmpA-like peptidoglycan-associated protein
MSENPSKSTAPANNQNVLILIVIAMLGVIALMMFFSMQKGNGSATSSSADQERLLALRKSIEAKELELKSQGIALPADTGSIDQLSQRISQDAMALRNNVETIQQALSAKESALMKAEADLNALKRTFDNTNTEAAKMRSQLIALEGQQANISILRDEVEALKLKLSERDKQIEELSKRPNADTVNQFRASLNETMLTNEQLNKRIAELELQNSNALSSTEAESLRAQINQLVPENEQLRLELQQLRAANDYDSLYAKSAEELRPEAARLYADLQKLEGLTPDQLEAAYMKISLDHNAHMLRSVRFKTGSSDVSWQTLTSIKDTITTAKKDSFFLVVGYASKTGNADNNKILSAKRSVTIASIVKHLKGGIGTRAVFLGQTDRFSKQPLDNQICEIWELRK